MITENLKNITNNINTTNGDKAYASSFNSNLDLFSSASNLRKPSRDEVYNKIIPALLEDKNTFFKNLFFLRDVQNGNGLRNSFRKALIILSESNPEDLIKILPYIPEYGRWDDINELLLSDNEMVVNSVIELINTQLSKDLNSQQNISLLAKWLPSINTSSPKTRSMAKVIVKKLFNGNEKEYRKVLSGLRSKLNLLEKYMTEKDYSFDYSALPGAALHKHTAAFRRNDEKRYLDYLDSLNNNKNLDKLSNKVKKLYPYEIYAKAKYPTERELANAMWEAMPKPKMFGKTLIISDLSGSMNIGLPGSRNYSIADVARSLTILGAEMLQGEFHNKAILFSRKPKFLDIKGETLSEKISYLFSNNHDAINTDIAAVYDLILKASINIPEEERIDTLLLISDGEFDRQVQRPDLSTYENMKANFEEAGVKVPHLVFWNLNVNRIAYPSTDFENTSIISGFSQSLFTELLTGEKTSSIDLMMKNLNKYTFIDELFPIQP